MSLYEDGIGLHADVHVQDETLVKQARAGKIRGWSFGMYNVKDELEQRAEELPVRHIRDLNLDHVTLVINKQPCYSATSVEIRADAEVEMETRSMESIVKVTEEVSPSFDNSAFRRRAEQLKK